MHLAIDLRGKQPIYFSNEEIAEEIHNRMESAWSTLMANFEYNALHSDGH